MRHTPSQDTEIPKFLFVTLRFDFINVTLNGINMGIYAIEESIDKILVENNNYREGPVIKFNFYKKINTFIDKDELIHYY